MYPADQLGIGYSEADLPDSITITIDGFGGDSRSAPKIDNEYIYGEYLAIPNLKFGVVDGAWVFIPAADNLQNYVQECLFATLGGTSEAEFTIDDNFADTYTFSTATFGGISTTLSRQSLCEWTGTVLLEDPPFPFKVRLIYSEGSDPSITGSAFRPVWVVVVEAAGGVNWFKINLSSPEGTYFDADGLYQDATISQ